MKKITLKKAGPVRTMYRGKIFSIKERDITFSDGSKKVYEYCERPDSVSVLAFNDKGELLLIKERRQYNKPPVWFLPGGRIDKKGDTPKKAAVRELREETGYSAKTLKLAHKKTPSQTLLWDIYIFAAKNLEYKPLPNEVGEDTVPHFVPFQEAVTMALNGTIENEFVAYNIIRFSEMVKHGEFSW